VKQIERHPRRRELQAAIERTEEHLDDPVSALSSLVERKKCVIAFGSGRTAEEAGEIHKTREERRGRHIAARGMYYA